MSDEPFIYHYNTDEVSATISTLDTKTVIKGYGKRKSDTKNYNPIKPKDLTYSGTFDKSGTWSTTTVGASYSKQFECKWGNETLVWTLKKMAKGGLVDVYLDDKRLVVMSVTVSRLNQNKSQLVKLSERHTYL